MRLPWRKKRKARPTILPAVRPTGRERCMIYSCAHKWYDIPDPGGYVGRHCSRCGAYRP